MDDRNQDSYGGPNLQRSTLEPLRTRWTPKPEQILILESIFNSGMVNPPKDETVRIRKLLEQFGSVGDANVFYWFQNRRSRSRRRQRQLQASLMADPRAAGAAQHAGAAATSSSSNSPGGGFFACASSPSAAASSSSDFVIDDSADDLFSISRQMGFMEATQTTPFTCSSGVSHLHIQPETITVFIDGVASEVPKGPIDLRAAFGHNVMLVHSSGQLLPVNEHGILMQSLQMGESYFSVILTGYKAYLAV